MPSQNRKQFAFIAGVIVVVGAIGMSPRAQTPPATTAPTFTHDVAPILYANCVECHRASGRKWRHAAVACRRTPRDVSQRARPDAGAKGSARTVDSSGSA